MRDEFLDPTATSDTEEIVEAGLRPRHLAEFVGQRARPQSGLDDLFDGGRRRRLEELIPHGVPPTA